MEFHQPSGGVGCPTCGQRIFSTRGVCHRCCPHTNTEIVRVLKVNGTTSCHRKCVRCLEWCGGVKNADVPDLDALPVHANHRGGNPPCEHCGAADTELHHYAPRAMFVDADDWATGYLCVRCHQHWHAVINSSHRRAAG